MPRQFQQNPATRLDLNLLKVFMSLIREGSVTRAAAKLEMTQSATSNALARLRAQLGDPLFTRTQHGVEPTPRAVELTEPFQRALDEIDRAVNNSAPFNPVTSDKTFRLMVTDHVCARLSPVLARIASGPSSRVRFDMTSVGPDSDYDRLRSGNVDLMVSYLILQPPPSFKTQKLFAERHVVVARTDHPAARGGLTLRRYLETGHIVVAPRGSWVSSPIDLLLSKRNLAREIKMTVPHYLAAPAAVAASDLMVALPESIADAYQAILPIQKLALPFDMRSFTVSMVWHERNHDESAHKWLRRSLKDALSRPRD